MVASGTFGYGKEYDQIVDIKKLGAIVTKTITFLPRTGNPAPRVVETPSGMLNAIGLENGGVDSFIKEKMPYLKKIGIPVIVSIGGEKTEEFIELARRLDGINGIAGLEVNISCPNLQGHKVTRSPGHQIRLFSQDTKATYELVSKVRKMTGLTLITKLTPNVTDIAEIAKAAEEAGSDAVSLVNTYLGMAVNIFTRRPRLGNVTGGLSGPAIKPLALRAVWDVYKAVKIPIIGMGGITTAHDVIEFVLCGARAVAIGTANFVHPNTCVDIMDGIRDYMIRYDIKKIGELVGKLKAGKA
jgi:dihydroorotate dehydrogenase (NAD+) catalytic subunit